MHSKDKLFHKVNWLNSKTEMTVSSETEEKAMQLLSYSFFFTSHFHQWLWLSPAFEGMELLPQNISFSYLYKPENILHELSPT